jgi:heptosyltransferase-2
MKQPISMVTAEGGPKPAPIPTGRPDKPTGEGLKIFIKGLNWVGDAIMATPTLTHLRQQLPRAEITMMVRPWVAPVYEHNPDIDQLWVHDDAASFGEFLEAVRMVRRENFDVGIAFPNSLRSALMLKWGGVRQRYGYLNRFGRGFLLNHPVTVKPEALSGHQVYYYMNLLETLCGIPRKAPDQRFVCGDLEREEVDRLLLELGLDRGQRLVGIAPGSINSTAKRWPAERFAQAADGLVGEMKASVLLLGSAREQDVLDRVESLCRAKVFNLAGKINLGQLAALVDRLDGLVTNDSGGMHVAAALQVPTVAIFGPTEWNTTYPFSPVARVVRKEGVPCAPCMLRECPINGHPCMTGVTVETVLATLHNLMEKSPRRNKSQPWQHDPRQP